MKHEKDWDTYRYYTDPIPGVNPAGEDLRYEPIYDEIREARRQDDHSLPQGVWQHELKVADWDKVEILCAEALHSKSKDLQIAAWLMESWFHQKGIKGLYHGAQVMYALCEKYWDQLYPPIEDDDIDYRLAPVDWINEKLPDQISLYGVSFPRDENIRQFTFSEYEFLYKDRQNKTTQAEHPEISFSNIKTSIASTEDYIYEVLYNDTLETIEAFETLEQYLTDALPRNRVSLYKIRNLLGRYRDFCLTILSERGLLKPKSTVENDEEEIEEFEETPMTESKSKQPEIKTDWANSKFESREQAYAVLAEIATYLEAIEPHSPTPYLLKKAISWGNMHLNQLLQEFIENNMDFAQLQKWLGIPANAGMGGQRNVASNE